MLTPIEFPINVPDTLVAAIPVRIPVNDIAPTMDAAITELVRVVDASGVVVTGDLLAYHHRRRTDTFDCEIAIPIASTIEDNGRVRTIILPAARFVRATYTGPYEGLRGAWREFSEAVKKAGIESDEVFWEHYHRANTPDSDPASFTTVLYRRLLEVSAEP
ncbi:MAG: GyrI-like domain-containing protein [Candidatus Kapaibacterium sp.]